VGRDEAEAGGEIEVVAVADVVGLVEGEEDLDELVDELAAQAGGKDGVAAGDLGEVVIVVPPVAQGVQVLAQNGLFERRRVALQALLPACDDAVRVLEDGLMVDVGQELIAPDGLDLVLGADVAAQPAVQRGVDKVDAPCPAAIDGDALAFPARFGLTEGAPGFRGDGVVVEQAQDDVGVVVPGAFAVRAADGDGVAALGHGADEGDAAVQAALDGWGEGARLICHVTVLRS
jgi:hypothetical protein